MVPRDRRLLRLLALSVPMSVCACGFDSTGIGGEGGGLGHGDDSTTAGGSASTAPDDAGASTTPGSATQPVDPDASAGSSSGAGTTTEGSATTTRGGSSDGTDGPMVDCAAGWWDVQWTHRRAVAISGEVLAGTESEPVVLLRLGPQHIDYALASPAGDDLRFVAGGVELAYEIELWDEAGRTMVWLRLPALPARGTSVDMYWGNPAASPASDGAATWPDTYLSVHHLGSEADSTGVYNAFSNASPATGDGVIGLARDFDGDDDFLELPTEADFDFTTAFTVEAWIRVDAFDTAWQAIITKGDNAWRLQRANTGPGVSFGSNSPLDNLHSVASVDDGQWHHVAIVLDQGVKRIYIDGVQDTEANVGAAIATNNRPVQFGANDQVSGRNFDGRIDEVRISSVARTPESIAWHHLSTSAGVVTVGPLQICG